MNENALNNDGQIKVKTRSKIDLNHDYDSDIIIYDDDDVIIEEPIRIPKYKFEINDKLVNSSKKIFKYILLGFVGVGVIYIAISVLSYLIECAKSIFSEVSFFLIEHKIEIGLLVIIVYCILSIKTVLKWNKNKIRFDDKNYTSTKFGSSDDKNITINHNHYYDLKNDKK